MNRILLALSLVCLPFALTTRAAEPPALTAHPDTRGWPDLFAPNLGNAIFAPGVWAWHKGVLAPKDKDEAIWTKAEYQNFILDLEFNLAPAANSGVLVYSTDITNWVPNTVEIQLLDDAASKWANIPANWKCGGIFAHSVPLASAVKKPGEWNHMTIRCLGPRISVLLNGKLVTDANMKDWKSGKKNPDGSDIVDFEPRPLAEMATHGHIGLQGAHGGIPTRFRRIKIQVLDERP